MRKARFFLLQPSIKSKEMSNNKRSLYFLFPVVVIIWGIAIWKLLESFSDDPPARQTPAMVINKPIKMIRKDTFSLLTLESDPFLGLVYKKPGRPVKSRVIPPIEIEWPVIKYLGLVSDAKISSKIYVLRINEQQYLMEPGSEEEGVSLIRDKKGLLLMSYKGIQKEFLKIN